MFVAITIVFLVALGLTFGLRGAVPAQTIKVVDLTSQSAPYGESDSAARTGYTDNFTGWFIGNQDQNFRTQVTGTGQGLSIQGQFEIANKFTSVSIFKQVNIDLASFPLLVVNLNASSRMSYGLRLYSQYQNGTTANIWWEGSPLDHRPGAGADVIRANMEYQSILSTGQTFDKLYYLETYVEAAPNTSARFSLSISRLDFQSDKITPIMSNGEFRAIYVPMNPHSASSGSWNLEKIHFGVKVTATAGTVLQMFLVQGSRVYSSLSSTDYVYSSLNSYNEFTFYPSQTLRIFPEVLPVSGSSVIIVAETGSIQSVAVDSLDLIFLPTSSSSSDLSPVTFASYYTYLVSFLFLVPVPIALMVFWRFFPKRTVGRAPVIFVAAIGLLCRLAIAPVATHRFDMDVFLASTRSWFQYGTPNGSIGPTLPLTFLFYWIPYSFYALLQILGFHDMYLPTHQEGVVEGIFIKMFPFAADMLVFFVLLQVRRGGKSLVWAGFYLLNPLSIYISAVWGQYDVASVALIVLGVFWMIRGKVGRAGLTFMLSGMIQLIGFIPYTLTLVRTALEKKYSSIPVLAGAATLVLVYKPEALLLYLLVLAASGVTRSLSVSGPGVFSLAGSFPSISFITSLHPILISLGVIGGVATYLTIKGKLTHDAMLLLTIFVSITLLLFSDILAGWVWLLPLVLFYAALKGKEGLGVFSLVFGTSTAFLMMSFPIGSRYVLTGNPNFPIVPVVEGLSHGVQIFVLSVTVLTGVLLSLIWLRRADAYKTLGLTAGLTIALNLVLMLGLGGLLI